MCSVVVLLNSDGDDRTSGCYDDVHISNTTVIISAPVSAAILVVFIIIVILLSSSTSSKTGNVIITAAQRHDTIRDLLTSHISKVCRNVETEPLLQPLDNEVFNLQSTVMSREARLDMKAGGFWTPGVTAFFDVRVTHVNSRSNQGKHTATIFKEQENEKKR
ncbi:uncharacterized protein LOC141863342 [Acropora palmata]|uniref:uncharacterized protein LOC141863342 n=1 Tax=Acropora palmata TaxID=6131 RepID=UPI003DA04313